MPAPIWIELAGTLVIHDQSLAEHGGLEGVRDQTVLESALARPKNLLAYSKMPVSLPRLAAAYAFGIVRNHLFVDGNKRTALIVAFTFLELNGIEINAPAESTYLAFFNLAAGKLSEDGLTQWLEQNAVAT